jgi:hypothetical protein
MSDAGAGAAVGRKKVEPPTHQTGFQRFFHFNFILVCLISSPFPQSI